MEIAAERLNDGSVALLALRGELDASNFEALIEAARAEARDGATALVLDLRDLSYMGSSGLVALHSAALLMRGQEPPSPESGWSAFHDVGHAVAAGSTAQPVALVAPQPGVRRVLDRSGMSRIFPIHPDRETALASVAGAAT